MAEDKKEENASSSASGTDTPKGGNKKGKSCPKGQSGRKKAMWRNDPAWYEAAGHIPLLGANWARLTEVGIDSVLKLRLNACGFVACDVAPPVDKDNTFAQEIAAFYQDIRERNSGAANYSEGVVAAYVLCYRNAAVAAHTANKKLAAIEASFRAFKESPYILGAVAGTDGHAVQVADIANVRNRLALALAQFGDIPMIPFSIFASDQWRFQTIFCDEAHGKPALFAFNPDAVWTPTSWSKTKGNYEMAFERETCSSGTLASAIKFLEDMIAKITTEEDFTVLRGDIRNAYGSISQVPFKLDEQVHFAPNDAEARSQFDNMGVLWQFQGANSDDWSCAMAADGTVTLKAPCDGRNDHGYRAKPSEDQQMLNWHGSGDPDSKMTAAITRLMPIAEQENPSGLSRTVWNIKATDGVIPHEIYNITSLNQTSRVLAALGQAVGKAQDGDAAALRHVAWITNVYERFPLIYTAKANDTTGYGMAWGIGKYATMSKDALMSTHIAANRSLFFARRPRRSDTGTVANK